MTREEAVDVLKALMKNPLFNEVYKVAFNIAIHDIKAYHKWDLNELVLTQKDNEQEPVIDKITELIEPLRHLSIDQMSDIEWQILRVIDKYKAEQEK